MEFPCTTLRTRVPPAWIDVNGHMNSTHYGLVIYDAHVVLTGLIGLADDYVRATNCSKAVVESHMIYEREVSLGDDLEVVSWLLAVDAKRMHFVHELMNRTSGQRAALSEQLDVHIDLGTRRAAPMAPATLERLQAIARQCAAASAPEPLGRAIRPPRV